MIESNINAVYNKLLIYENKSNQFYGLTNKL